MNCFGTKVQSKPTTLHCVVELLDGTEIKLYIKADDTGLVLLQKVWEHLNLFEKEYFSLRFLNTSNKTSFWLDGQKNIHKQLKRHGIKEKQPKFYFGVKFYAVDPCRLREEITRYQFFQQLRRDVASGRIPLTFSLLAELGALVAQSEFGDYDQCVHREGYLQSLKLMTGSLSDELQTAITELHREKLRGVLPSQCEMQYLNLMKKQEVYGVEFYNARGAANAEYKVGVSPHGILIYRGKHRVSLYHWPRINVINFKGKELILKVRDKHGRDITTHSFNCSNTRVCKQAWKSCIEHHSFFRLSDNKQNQESPEKSRFLSLGSKYRYSGRTEREMVSTGCRIEEPTVNRPLSRRSSVDRSHGNTEGALHHTAIGESSSEPKHKTDNSANQGMFTASNWSPGSVRSFKMKFQPKSSDFDGETKSLRDQAPRSPRYGHQRGADRQSMKSAHSQQRNQADKKPTRVSQSERMSFYAEQQARQSSVSRIVRGYIPNTKTSFFNRDQRRHSDRGTKPREYENIVYNDHGLPVILATHKGEKADKNMPYYQQDWLLSNAPEAKKYSKEPAVTSIFTRSTQRASFNDDRALYQYTDPLMYSILHSTDKSTKPSLSFYEEKMLNRDSGTDSPTCNNYDDQNIYTLMKTLGKEREQLSRGDGLGAGNRNWVDNDYDNRELHTPRAATNHRPTQCSSQGMGTPRHPSGVRITII